jgi:hypothetical protein
MINTDTCSSSNPPWCPLCGADFQPAPKTLGTPTPGTVAHVPAAVRRTAAVCEALAPLVPPPPLVTPVTPVAITAVPPSIPPAPRLPLPASAPDNVGTLGEPEWIHAPDGKQIGQNVLTVRILAGCVAMLFLAFAVLLFYVAAKPFGTNPPAPAVALLIGVICTAIALPMVAVAVFFQSIGWVRRMFGPSTFLVYPHGLLEQRGTRRRLIRWEDFGPPQKINVLVTYYRFPVRGDKALAFDNTVGEHEKLCATIEARAGQRQAVAAFGDEAARVVLGDAAARAEMAAAPPGPSVLAVKLGVLSGSVYRITMLGRHLLFYSVAAGAGISASPRPNAGAIEAWGHARMRQKFLEEMRQVEQADAPTLLELAAKNEGSFVATAENLVEVRLDAPSVVKQIFMGLFGTAQEGSLTVTHARYGKLALALLEREDVLTVAQEWPKILGALMQVNVVWSHSACAFVGKV